MYDWQILRVILSVLLVTATIVAARYPTASFHLSLADRRPVPPSCQCLDSALVMQKSPFGFLGNEVLLPLQSSSKSCLEFQREKKKKKHKCLSYLRSRMRVLNLRHTSRLSRPNERP